MFLVFISSTSSGLKTINDIFQASVYCKGQSHATTISLLRFLSNTITIFIYLKTEKSKKEERLNKQAKGKG